MYSINFTLLPSALSWRYTSAMILTHALGKWQSVTVCYAKTCYCSHPPFPLLLVFLLPFVKVVRFGRGAIFLVFLFTVPSTAGPLSITVTPISNNSAQWHLKVYIFPQPQLSLFTKAACGNPGLTKNGQGAFWEYTGLECTNITEIWENEE